MLGAAAVAAAVAAAEVVAVIVVELTIAADAVATVNVALASFHFAIRSAFAVHPHFRCAVLDVRPQCPHSSTDC